MLPIAAKRAALSSREGVGGWEALRKIAPTYATPATTIYVSGSSPASLAAGNDTTGDGSIGAPYATLEKAKTVISSAGGVLVLCDGTFSENTAAGGRLILNKTFASPVVFDSYTGSAANFIVTNASGTSGVVSVRSNATSNIYFRRATLRTSTDACPVFLFNPSSSGFTATNIRFYDCVFEGKTQASNSLGVIDLRTDFALSGLYFVRCSFQKTVGGSTAVNPIIIGTNTVTATTANQPFADVGFWDCSTTDANWYSFTNTNFLVGVARFTAVRNNFQTGTNYGIAIGKDSAADTAPKCTDVFIVDNTVVCTGSNPHGILVGSNVQATGEPTATDGVTVSGNIVTSGLQGIVTKGCTNAVVKNNVVNLTATAATGSGIYAKASTGSKFRSNTINLNGASFACIGFREGIDGVTKAGTTELTSNTIAATGGNAQALLWADGTGSSGGAVANDNSITLASSAVLGSVRGATVTTQADLRAVWGTAGISGDSATNDSRSLVA